MMSKQARRLGLESNDADLGVDARFDGDIDINLEPVAREWL